MLLLLLLLLLLMLVLMLVLLVLVLLLGVCHYISGGRHHVLGSIGLAALMTRWRWRYWSTPVDICWAAIGASAKVTVNIVPIIADASGGYAPYTVDALGALLQLILYILISAVERLSLGTCLLLQRIGKNVSRWSIAERVLPLRIGLGIGCRSGVTAACSSQSHWVETLCWYERTRSR